MAADWRSLLKAFVEDLGSRGLSRSSRRRALLVLPRLFAHLLACGVRDVRRVNLAHLQSFAARLARTKTRLGVPLSPTTLQHYLFCVRGFFAFLERRREVLVNPAKGLAMPRTDRLPREVLSVSQAERLVEAPSALTRIGQRDRAILELFYGTGLRLREVERLDLQDLDLVAGQLLVRDGKGKKDRVVPVAGRAAAALDVYLREVRPLLEGHEPSGALFLSRDGVRLSVFSLQGLVRRHGRRAGLRVKLSTHVLRHACATHLLKGGADIRMIQALLGHKDIETTERYTRVAIEDLKAMIDRAHPRNRG